MSDFATLPQSQQFETNALGATAWALLEAEAHGNRALAASAVPVFIASWNAYGTGVRTIAASVGVSAPGSLSLSGGGWSPAHDTALKLTLWSIAVRQPNTTQAQHDHIVDLLDSMPGGMPFQAFRGVWFDTTFVPAMGAPEPVEYADAMAQFQRGGAAALSTASDEISRGIDPNEGLPQLPSMVPTVPPQTPHPSSADAIAFVMPRAGTVSTSADILITGRTPAAREAFPVGAMIALGIVGAIGIGFAAYAVSRNA